MPAPHPASRGAVSSRKVECIVAAMFFAVPLWFFVTEISPDPFVLGWSKRWLAMLLVYAACYVTLLASYRWRLFGWQAVAPCRPVRRASIGTRSPAK